ncbi:MAG: 23S rRNA (guanosine(2251)-2'-O)-methyltransferase, partial [uncultured Rubrobacteraceae bacterium]
EGRGRLRRTARDRSPEERAPSRSRGPGRGGGEGRCYRGSFSRGGGETGPEGEDRGAGPWWRPPGRGGARRALPLLQPRRDPGFPRPSRACPRRRHRPAEPRGHTPCGGRGRGERGGHPQGPRRGRDAGGGQGERGGERARQGRPGDEPEAGAREDEGGRRVGLRRGGGGEGPVLRVHQARPLGAGRVRPGERGARGQETRARGMRRDGLRPDARRRFLAQRLGSGGGPGLRGEEAARV